MGRENRRKMKHATVRRKVCKRKRIRVKYRRQTHWPSCPLILAVTSSSSQLIDLFHMYFILSLKFSLSFCLFHNLPFSFFLSRPLISLSISSLLFTSPFSLPVSLSSHSLSDSSFPASFFPYGLSSSIFTLLLVLSLPLCFLCCYYLLFLSAFPVFPTFFSPNLLTPCFLSLQMLYFFFIDMPLHVS